MAMSKVLAQTVVSAMLVLAPVVYGADDEQKEREQETIRSALQRGEALPLVRILAIAGQHVPGDIIEMELEDEHKTLVYEIKVLASNGRVREVKIDARTGKVLEIEDD